MLRAAMQQQKAKQKNNHVGFNKRQSMVSFDDFNKLDLRVAKIIDAEDHPNADRLWVLRVDIGADEPKEIVAGIKSKRSREDLIGKSIILVNNLEPATIRGVQSNGMLLAAKGDEEFALLTPDSSVPAGAKVG